MAFNGKPNNLKALIDLTLKHHKPSKQNTADIQFDCKILPTATEIKLTSVFFDEDAVC